jgi:shikimate kinase
MKKSLFLCGLMGSGKSFLGNKLARVLEIDFIDLDDKIEQDEESSISSIFREKGEAFFRALELSHISALLEKKVISVIALGGGAVCFNSVDRMIESKGILIYFYSSPKNIFERLKLETHRPLLNDENGNLLSEKKILNKLEVLHNKRSKFYEKAHLQINVDELSVDEVLAEIRDFYEHC